MAGALLDCGRTEAADHLMVTSDQPGVPGWAQRRGKESEGDGRLSCGIEDTGRGHQPGIVGASGSWGRSGNRPSPGTSSRHAALQTPGFRPARPILDSWRMDCKETALCYAEPLSPWCFVRAARKRIHASLTRGDCASLPASLTSGWFILQGAHTG